MRSRSYSYRRWIDLFFLTLIAVMICVLFFPLLKVCFEKVGGILALWPQYIQYLIISLIAGFLWFIIIRLNGFRPSDLVSIASIRYPPVWFAGLLGASIYILTVSQISPYKYHLDKNIEFWGLLGGIILLGFVLATLLDTYLFSYGKRDEVEADSFDLNQNNPAILENEASLIEWISKETPIKYPSQDIFELKIIARRIASKMHSKDLKTVGIVGPYGSGKSSVLNLVKYYLLRNLSALKESTSINTDQMAGVFDGDFLVCYVDGWGRIKGSIAQQILSIAVERLSLEVDCLSVITVPANYRKALSNTKGSLGSIVAALLDNEEDPIQPLRRLDAILKAINSRLVIFLEDLDRNVSDEVIKDEVPSLLDRLHCLNNISFVLAIGTEHHYSDILIRICEHVENIAC